MRILRRTLTFPLAAAAFLGGCAAAGPVPPAGPGGEPVDPAVAVATFDTVWATVQRTHWDTTFAGVDWAGVRSELRPRAEAARTENALRAVVGEMLGRLGQSHFGVIPREAADPADGAEPGAAGTPGTAGLEARVVDGALLVTRVDAGGAAAAAGVRPGWILERVGTVDATEVIRRLAEMPDGGGLSTDLYVWSRVARALSGPVGDTVRAVFLDEADRRTERALVLREEPGLRTRIGHLPEMTARLEDREAASPGGARVGILRMSVWMPVLSPELDRAVDRFRDADAMVVDLRGNVGGVGFMAPGAAGHFLDRGDTLGVMITRGDRLHFYVNPRRSTADGRRVEPFSGPVAVLVDGVSASTSEFFAGGMQALGRARVFGTRTAGQALPAHLRRLPNGDVLMYAVADFVGPDGRRWEGEGVIPDVPAPPTRAALLAGRDPALDAALSWIDEARSGASR